MRGSAAVMTRACRPGDRDGAGPGSSVMALAQRAGAAGELAGEHVRIGQPCGANAAVNVACLVVGMTALVILSFRVSQGCDLRRPVVDSVADGTLAA